jgi:hypothetical protein
MQKLLKSRKPFWLAVQAKPVQISPNEFACGNIIMPQRRFSVHASINLDRADAKGVIFSSLIEHRWMQQAINPTDPLGNTRGHDVPRAQGAEAGLQIYLLHGKLAANLNGTSSPPLKPSLSINGLDLMLPMTAARWCCESTESKPSKRAPSLPWQR